MASISDYQTRDDEKFYALIQTWYTIDDLSRQLGKRVLTQWSIMTDMLDLEINVVRSNVLLCLTAKKPIAQLPHSVDDELEETDIDLADEKN